MLKHFLPLRHEAFDVLEGLCGCLKELGERIDVKFRNQRVVAIDVANDIRAFPLFITIISINQRTDLWYPQRNAVDISLFIAHQHCGEKTDYIKQ